MHACQGEITGVKYLLGCVPYLLCSNKSHPALLYVSMKFLKWKVEFVLLKFKPSSPQRGLGVRGMWGTLLLLLAVLSSGWNGTPTLPSEAGIKDILTVRGMQA